MILKGTQTLLRIFIGQSEKLHLAIQEKARGLGIAGCTITCGVLGFGANTRAHAELPVEVVMDLPMLVEIVDSKQKVDGLLEAMGDALDGKLVTREDVIVHHYNRSSKK